MTNSFTPGPWRARGAAVRPEKGVGRTGGYSPILLAQHDKRMADCREANARLAAASPELFDALVWAICQMPAPSLKGEYATGYLAAKAAIHKAINK